MHALPEANFINPAVQIECGTFIGIPLLSSTHLNIANSGFTMGQLLNKQSDGSYAIDADKVLKRLGNRNYAASEIHTVLFAAGLKRNDYYYTFTITEKDNLTGVYTRDLVAFGLEGNSMFEGEWINLNGTGIALSHLREFAFGISKKYNRNFTMGAKVKLLFGKLNIEPNRSRNQVYTQPNTLDLLFDIDAGFNSSFPYSMGIESDGTYRFYERYEGSVMSYLMNRQNPGFAIDLGFIYRYSDRITLSGSLLDAGLIWYRSNLTNYSLKGEHLYQGPLGDITPDGELLRDIFDELNANLSVDLGYDPYLDFLDPRINLGAAYKMNDRLDLNVLVFSHLVPGKIQTGTSVSLLTRPSELLQASVSWSFMHRSFSNVGLGVAYGKTPMQVYLVTDNILGFVLPMHTKNVNLRLGLNLNLGCREETDMGQCGCAWLREAETRQARKAKLRKGN